MTKDTLSALGFIVLFFGGGILFATVLDKVMDWNLLATSTMFIALFLTTLFFAMRGEHSS
ncbi:MAG: hypothetical protein H7Y22_02245 [Gemmatimonadaceae bacterium]|nr:hypothetical protein [Gloeobacterales cyanobacterium ES-bin-141]